MWNFITLSWLFDRIHEMLSCHDNNQLSFCSVWLLYWTNPPNILRHHRDVVPEWRFTAASRTSLKEPNSSLITEFPLFPVGAATAFTANVIPSPPCDELVLSVIRFDDSETTTGPKEFPLAHTRRENFRPKGKVLHHCTVHRTTLPPLPAAGPKWPSSEHHRTRSVNPSFVRQKHPHPSWKAVGNC